MRLIGSLKDKTQADHFAAYLLTQGVNTHLEPEKDEIEVWIKDEDRVDHAIALLTEFRGDPKAAKFVDAIPRAKEIQDQLIKKRQRIKKNVVNVTGGKMERSHPLTVSLMVICGVVAILTNFGGPESTDKATFRALAFNGVANPDAEEIWLANDQDPEAMNVRLASLRRGEVWRLATPMFLHHGVFHLLFNMYWLFIFGSQIENRYGSFWFGMLVIGAAMISNFAQCTVPLDVGGSVPVFTGSYLINGLGGMSGVVYALFGFVLMRMTYDRSSGLFVQQSTVVLLLIWLVFCMTPLALELMDLTTANWAHAIGLLVGLIVGYFPTQLKKR